MAADDKVSERALTIAEFVRDPMVFNEQAVWDLHRMLSHEIAGYDSGRRRMTDLGLLIQIIAREDDPDGWITEAQYDAENSRADEHWPSSSTLERMYGTWARAVNHALSTWFKAGRERLKARRQRPRGWTRGYSQRDIALAIRRCAGDLGHWPVDQEFYDYGRVMRGRASTDPRIPGYQQVKDAFGSYAAAVRAAKEMNA